MVCCPCVCICIICGRWLIIMHRENTLRGGLDRLFTLKQNKLNTQIDGLKNSIHCARMSAAYAEDILEHASPLQVGYRIPYMICLRLLRIHSPE